MTSSPDPTIQASLSNHNMADDKSISISSISIDNEEKVRLLYSKSKVYLHPTPSIKDNIHGYIALLQRYLPQNSKANSSDPASQSYLGAESFLLAWIPETSLGDALKTYNKVESDEDDSSPKKPPCVPLPPVIDHPSLVRQDGFAVPIKSIYSIFTRLPSPGWWFGSLIINSRAGDPFPALFFHDSECESTKLQKKKCARKNFDIFGLSGAMFWGGDQVLTWLTRHITVRRCEVERNIYLIEPTNEDQKAFARESVTATHTHLNRQENIFSVSKFEENRERSLQNAQMDPLMKFVKDAGWNLMEKFSQVTTFARRTADSVVENPNLPPQVRRLLRNPEVLTLQEEFDSARLYLAKWAMGIAEMSERERKQRNLMARRASEIERTGVGDFELLNAEIGALSVQETRKPVSLVEWNSFFDQKNDSLIYSVDEVKKRIFHGGLDAEDGVRKEAWLFLLGVFSWDSTAKERKQKISELRDEYLRLKGAWWNRLANQVDEGKELEWWYDQRSRIEKDVHRTDRTIPLFMGEDTPHPDPSSSFAEVGTNVHLEQLKDMLLTYNEYNRELGYVQGMSDLLAPIYAVMQDDAVAFWAFKNFMLRMERNFLRDQSGMRKQLLALENLVQLMDPKLYLHLQSADCINFFFFFRMLLVWFKREFSWENVLSLWERLWTDFLTSNFHIFVAFAILEKHRDVIMEHLKHFDEVLKYVNELSTTIDLEATLISAEALFHRFQRTIDTIDNKSNFPSPSLRQRKTKAKSLDKATISADMTSGSNAKPIGFSDSSNSSCGEIIKNNSGRNKSETKESTEPKINTLEIISPELRQLLSREVEIIDKS
ncbi:putative gtpase-activating protein gyp7 [Erysiphe necator]|uniref:GTPase-activating protein GYP7 n=1 Tax=Uncinula necator TaxID=52586 RepID=A0A0B1P1I8_UNCNE|nr:putative gtpase-activating protein gyp7 [Erysiphe necator]